MNTRGNRQIKCGGKRTRVAVGLETRQKSIEGLQGLFGSQIEVNKAESSRKQNGICHFMLGNVRK
jgi:hypothetical protein